MLQNKQKNSRVKTFWIRFAWKAVPCFPTNDRGGSRCSSSLRYVSAGCNVIVWQRTKAQKRINFRAFCKLSLKITFEACLNFNKCRFLTQKIMKYSYIKLSTGKGQKYANFIWLAFYSGSTTFLNWLLWYRNIHLHQPIYFFPPFHLSYQSKY